MWLTDVAIKRPVFITMFFMALIVLGYRSVTLMPVDLYPKVDIPIITVTTTYAGAGPEEIETLVTKPIEDQVGTINKIDEVMSVSRDSISAVIVKFLLEADLDVAAADVRDKIDLARPDLPDDADDPIISKLDFGAMPVITMGITSDTMDIRSVKTLVEQNIEDRFSKLSGVGNVDVTGGDTRE
ncbi:MAG: efflux RND transporter permease subunit, partial [Candidatus Eremiobacterota bacterium]